MFREQFSYYNHIDGKKQKQERELRNIWTENISEDLLRMNIYDILIFPYDYGSKFELLKHQILINKGC